MQFNNFRLCKLNDETNSMESSLRGKEVSRFNGSGEYMKNPVIDKFAVPEYFNGKSFALQDTMSWLSGFLLIGGSVLIALSPKIGMSPIPYFAFLVANVCLSLRFIILRDAGQITLNVAMSMLDLYAIVLRV